MPQRARSPITIQQAATDEHFELAYRLHREYFRWIAEQFKETMSLDVDADVEGAAERFLAARAELMPPSGRLYLATQDGEPVATGALKSLGSGGAYLKRMFVRPEYRGQGLARRLLEQLLTDARDAGHRRILLETAPFMTAAHRLYESAGFRTREPFPESEVPPDFHRFLVFMELDL